MMLARNKVPLARLANYEGPRMIYETFVKVAGRKGT